MQLRGKDFADALVRSGLGVVRAGLHRLDPVEQLARQAVTAAADAVVPAVVAEIVARMDLTRLVQENVDLDVLAEGIDVDAIADRLDLLRLARYVVDGIDLPEIIRESSHGVTSDAVRRVRTQAIDADQAVARVVDRLLLRHAGSAAANPVAP